MPTEAKAREIEDFTNLLKESKSVVLTDYQGLDVASITELRSKCREAGVQFKVFKNTLAKRCISDAGMDGLAGFLEGPNAWATHKDDQVIAAKVLSEFAKENDKLELRAGFMEGRVIDVAEIQALAKLPSREVLLSQVAGTFQAPMASFASVCAAMLRGFATAVDALQKKRADEGAS